MESARPSAALSAAKRTGVKQAPWVRDAASRRREMVQQQRQARRDLTAHARRLAAGGDASELPRSGADASPPPPESEPESGDAMELVALAGDARKSKTKTREERVKRRREHFAQQLMVPEWMVDVPADLNGRGSMTGDGWYVLPRPEGKRCLVVASNGVTVARTQAGSILKKFPSALPNGSRKTARSGEAYCILDCIFHEHDETFYVLDVMCWKGYLLYNCTTEFRLYWLRDKLDEGTTATISSANPYRFLPVPCFECDEQGLHTAYATPFPFLKDGLLFLMKAAQYDLGLSPLALVWKDATTSRYFVFSDKPTIVLRLNGDGLFVTLEGIVLWAPDKTFVDANELAEGDLAKFKFDQGFIGEDNIPQLVGLTFVGRCSPQRALADSWTKIQFQYGARAGGLPIENILAATRNSVAMESV